MTGNPNFDGAASVLIGIILAGVAIFLAIEAKGLLIGEAASPELIAALRQSATRDGVMGIGEIVTIHNAPNQIVVAMNVDFDNRLGAGDVERIIDEIELDVRGAHPDVTRIYVRPHENAGLKFGDGRGRATGETG